MSSHDENSIKSLLGEKLGLEFKSTGLNLDTWGRVDSWAEVDFGCKLILEVESDQGHPTTNVLKIWPYIEENQEACVILAHVFRIGGRSESGSRARLAAWLGNRLEKELEGRFFYRRLLWSPPSDLQGLEELRVILRN